MVKNVLVLTIFNEGTCLSQSFIRRSIYFNWNAKSCLNPFLEATCTDNESDAISTVPRCPYRNCFPVLMFIQLASDLFGFVNTIVAIENRKTTYLECSLYCLQRCTLFRTHTRCFGTHCCLQRPDMHSYHHTPPPVHMVQTTSLLKHNVTDHIHTMSPIIYIQCHSFFVVFF